MYAPGCQRKRKLRLFAAFLPRSAILQGSSGLQIFSLLKKQRPIRSYSSDEQTTRQAGSKRAVCSKASKSVPQRYSGLALQ